MSSLRPTELSKLTMVLGRPPPPALPHPKPEVGVRRQGNFAGTVLSNFAVWLSLYIKW